MSYVTSVGGDPINPLIYTYSSVSITSDITMVWPSNNQDATYTATDWVDITSDAARTVTMPPANEAGTGDETVFYNWGSYTITINDSTGGNITTVASGLTKRIWITDNSTVAGTWRIANIGSGTTNADASMLAGYGIIAQAGLLSQSMPTSPISTTTTLNAGYRAYLVIWTGGSGTITLPSAVTVGSNWFLNVKNSGTGTLTINSGGSNIDGSSTASVAVNEGFTIATNGVTYYTVGRLTPNTSGYTLLNKSVTGSTDITLSASESVYNIINYTGTLGASFGIIVPSSVNEWIMSNSATGSTYTLQIKTSGGTGVTLSQGKTRTLYCDATDVFFSDAVGSGTVTSVGSGTGLTGGPITSSGSLSLANTAVVAGTYGSSSKSVIYTVDAQGRFTSSTDTTIDVSSVTGTLPVSHGGTGSTTLTLNNVILGNGTSAPQFISPSNTNYVVRATGTTWTAQASLATSSVAGFVIPDGTTITISAGAITVARASTSVLGAVKVDGTTIISTSGTISAAHSSTLGSTATLSPYSTSAIGTTAHGLASKPNDVIAYLENISAEAGYAVGERVPMGGANCSFQGAGITISFDSTNIYYYTNTVDVPDIVNKGTFARQGITASKWKVIMTPILWS